MLPIGKLKVMPSILVAGAAEQTIHCRINHKPRNQFRISFDTALAMIKERLIICQCSRREIYLQLTNVSKAFVDSLNSLKPSMVDGFYFQVCVPLLSTICAKYVLPRKQFKNITLLPWSFFICLCLSLSPWFLKCCPLVRGPSVCVGIPARRTPQQYTITLLPRNNWNLATVLPD